MVYPKEVSDEQDQFHVKIFRRKCAMNFLLFLGISESGGFCAYHNGLTFPFYGYPVADVIMHFILKVSTSSIPFLYPIANHMRFWENEQQKD